MGTALAGSTPGPGANLHDGTPGSAPGMEMRLVLESVIGLSPPGPGSFAPCPDGARAHLAAYAAGPAVVLYDTAARRQLAFLQPPGAGRALAAVAWAPGGGHVLAGEGPAPGGGAAPAAVHVWDAASGACVQALRGQHRHGVMTLCFSPCGARPGGGPRPARVCLWPRGPRPAARAGACANAPLLAPLRVPQASCSPRRAATMATCACGTGAPASCSRARRCRARPRLRSSLRTGSTWWRWARPHTRWAGRPPRPRARRAAAHASGSVRRACCWRAAQARGPLRPRARAPLRPAGVGDQRGPAAHAQRRRRRRAHAHRQAGHAEAPPRLGVRRGRDRAVAAGAAAWQLRRVHARGGGHAGADARDGAHAGQGRQPAGGRALSHLAAGCAHRLPPPPACQGADTCDHAAQVRAAYGLAAAPGVVAAACAHGIVRLFAARSLEFRGTLPRLLPRGGAAAAGVAPGGWRPSAASAGGTGDGDGDGVDVGALKEAAFPDALACAFDAGGARLAVAYRDRTLVMWDVARPASVRSCWRAPLLPVAHRPPPSAVLGSPARAARSPLGAAHGKRAPRAAQAERLFSLAAHCGGVWDLAMLPCPAAARAHPPGPPPPPARAATCSSDGTIRVWNLPCGGGGAGSRTLAGVINTSAADAGCAPAPGAAPGDPERPLPAPGRGGSASGGPPPTMLHCMTVSRDGRALAAGDSSGNLRVRARGASPYAQRALALVWPTQASSVVSLPPPRQVYDLATLKLAALIEAHDGVLLALDFAGPVSGGGGGSGGVGGCLLASGGRDGLIHLYDAEVCRVGGGRTPLAPAGLLACSAAPRSAAVCGPRGGLSLGPLPANRQRTSWWPR